MKIAIVGIIIGFAGQALGQSSGASVSEPPCDEVFPFYCDDGTCIHRTNFCDGKTDCNDGSDESPYNSTIHDGKGHNCTHRRSQNHTCFLPEKYESDHELDCVGGKDECGFDSSFYCANGDCALKISFCDGFNQCQDGTDEKPYNRSVGGFQCHVSKRHRTLSCLLPNVHLCDGSPECKWGTDECFCDFSAGPENGTPTKGFSNSKCFRCLDDTLVIPNYLVCDGAVHCQDLSDECLCRKNENMTSLCRHVSVDENECLGKLKCFPRLANGMKGTKEICVDTEKICDDRYDCYNGLDEDFCERSDELYTCKDERKKVRKIYVCDGQSDCEDGSDEDRCHEDKYICDIYKTGNWTHLSEWNGTGEFPRLNRTVVEKDLFRKFKLEWKFYFPYYATPCDRIATCNSGLDECGVSATGPNCITDPNGFCKFTRNERRKCPNSESTLLGYEVCDGQPTCNDTAPHTSADEMGCPNRFYCKDRGKTRLPIHIPKENQCNRLAECADESDEMNCPSETHFYCNNSGKGGNSFISKDRVCDRRKDCTGGEDECLECTKDPFSDDKNLIRSRVLVVFLWIIGLISTIGNTLVIFHHITHIYRERNARKSVALKNRILLLNLSTADLLMGIYLIALGIKDATVQKYCLQDQEWRSSRTCSALGAIALIGTEASVMILLIMTAHRLHLVFRPFGQQSISAIIVSVIFAWVIAIILATIPLSFSARNYFLSCVWFRSHRFLGYACKDDIREFTKKLVAFEGPSNDFSNIVGSDYSWNKMLDAQTVIDSSYIPERYYGYYAATGVCLPRFFPRPRSDSSWGYTLFLVLLNFFAFIVIMTSYIFIYRKSVSSKAAAKKRIRTSALQGRVTRIILTDFCCWMPICIMAFMTVGAVEVGDIAYAVTAIILLPINSAMNPFLYSSLLDIVWEQLLPVRSRIGKTALGQRLQKSSNKMAEGTGETLATSVKTVTAQVNNVESSGDGSSTNGVKKTTNEMNTFDVSAT